MTPAQTYCFMFLPVCVQNIVQAETEAVALNADPSMSAPGPPAAALMTWLQKDLSPP